MALGVRRVQVHVGWLELYANSTTIQSGVSGAVSFSRHSFATMGKRMKQFRLMGHLVWMSTLLLMMVACGGASNSAETPTPFPSNDLVVRALPGEPIPVSLDYLADNPTYFEGATLQLSGTFNRLPRLVCDNNPQRPPYSWGISNDNVMAQAGGMDESVRTLLPDGLMVTVEGTWLRWEGPVGCGKDAPVKQAWYLAVSRVLEPSPLVRITLTPDGAAPSDGGDNQPSPTPAGLEPMPVETIPSAETPTPEPTIEPTATFLATQPPANTPTATAETDATLAPTATTTPDPSASPSNTPTITPTSGPSPTPDPNATPTPILTATPTGNGGNPIDDAEDQGSVEMRDLAVESLSGGETHAWDIENNDGASSYSISIAPSSRTADIVFSLYTSDGDPITENANLAGPGSVEYATEIAVDPDDDHVLLVRTQAGTETDYAVMVQDSDDSFVITFEGRLTAGETESGTLGDENDHFWFFNGTSGSAVTITVNPTTNSDVYMELYDPDGVKLTEVDSEDAGSAETLDSYTLPDSGLFGIRIGEFDFEAMAYTIQLTEN